MFHDSFVREGLWFITYVMEQLLVQADFSPTLPLLCVHIATTASSKYRKNSGLAFALHARSSI